MRRYALRDDQWERIKDLLPGREGHVGVTAKDNRLFVEAVLYRYRAGIPWRDLPERFVGWIYAQRKIRVRGSLHERASRESSSPQPSKSELRSSRPCERGEGGE
jgi:transposase